MSSALEQELLGLNQALLNAIVGGDYETYKSFLSEDVTCFEDECCGYLVQGLSFHKFYFDLDAALSDGTPLVSSQAHMSQPHVRILSGGNAAVISYTRLNQRLDSNNAPVSSTICETRVWEKDNNGRWKNVHLHRG